MDPKERGEPITLWAKGLSELLEGVQKAACVQAMYDRGQQGIPITAPVDPRQLIPLIRGLPDSLKVHMQSLGERILGITEHNQQNPHKPPAHVMIWAEVQHSIVVHGCEMGCVESSGGTEGSRKVQAADCKLRPKRS